MGAEARGIGECGRFGLLLSEIAERNDRFVPVDEARATGPSPARQELVSTVLSDETTRRLAQDGAAVRTGEREDAPLGCHIVDIEVTEAGLLILGTFAQVISIIGRPGPRADEVVITLSVPHDGVFGARRAGGGQRVGQVDTPHGGQLIGGEPIKEGGRTRATNEMLGEGCGVDQPGRLTDRGIQLDGADHVDDVRLRVVADHARTVAFLIQDGVLPGNEGRGYVLRRILRRAVRHGRLLGRREPFMAEAAAVVIEVMGEAYPHLVERRDEILAAIAREETQFARTLDAGTGQLETALAAVPHDVAGLLHGLLGVAREYLVTWYIDFPALALGAPTIAWADAALRAKMVCVEDPRFTKDYLDAGKRSATFDLDGPDGDATLRWADLVIMTQYSHRYDNRPNGSLISRAEWRDALRWRLKDMVDFAVADAGILRRLQRAASLNRSR